MTLFDVVLLLSPLAIGWVLDYLFGDPEHLPHPIVWMGKWIAMWEKQWNNGEDRKAKGALLAIGSILLTFFATYVVLNISYWLFPSWHLGMFGWLSVGRVFYVVIASVLVFYCLAGHTLRKEVRMVFEAVGRSVEDGRKQVARIVGRDTANLNEQEIRTAALETLAENLSDGVVAPLFWYFFLGVPGMMAYKMVNTLDSMIGYKNERYREFGCWAAKIDDVANFIPARLTALLIAWMTKLYGNRYPNEMKKKLSMKEHLAFITFFGPQHASPNSGWPEAALAGMLDCRFGGTHDYFGEAVKKPYIGLNPRPLDSDDMKLSIRICMMTEIAMVTACFTISFCLMILMMLIH